MSGHGKKYRKSLESLGGKNIYPLREGVALLKKVAHARFDESVNIDVNLGIDPSKGDQVVRGGVVLPHGTGKKVRVLVFAKGEYADKAQAAGADYVGADDLIKKIDAGWFDFDYAVATPDLMGLVGKVAKTLGPLGLLPNKKLGTVTFDVDSVVKELKKGLVFFKNDKQGLVHFLCGKASFSEQQIADNIGAFLKALAASKPSASKGVFIKKVVISPTMGPGIPLQVDVL